MTVTDAVLDAVVQVAVLAADMEVMRAPPPSSVPAPDGSPQAETRAERERRVIGAAVRHCVATGLLMVAPDAAARMEAGVPLVPR